MIERARKLRAFSLLAYVQPAAIVATISSFSTQSPAWMTAVLHGVFSWMRAPVQSMGCEVIVGGVPPADSRYASCGALLTWGDCGARMRRS
jgi:hypothetical protein